MISRRHFVASAALISVATARDGVLAQDAGDNFKSLLADALQDEDAIEKARALREGMAQIFNSRAIAPRRPPSSQKISDDAINMIVGFEVSSKAAYERKYRGAIWPRGRSGVTCGIGYDVGYVTRAWLREDWQGVIPSEMIATLESACEVKGLDAKALLPRMTSVNISWDQAMRQFQTTAAPRYAAEVIRTVPNATKLSPDSFGALVSLVYNRGASFRNRGSRYAEMRNIHRHMAAGDYANIPQEFLDMRRIWEGDPDAKGLLKRRELEAVLFKRGLRSA